MKQTESLSLKTKDIKMKKLLLTTMVLGSTVAVAACTSNGGTSANDMDGALTQAPYAEERTVGATQAAPVVRSAEPVFESRQVK